jgi:hypothetical protein
MNRTIPPSLMPQPFGPHDTEAEDDTGLMPWYRGYSDAGRSVVAVCPYRAGSQAAILWHGGAGSFRHDQRTPVRRPSLLPPWRSR